MDYIINIDTATKNGSVSLSVDGKEVHTLYTEDQKSHAAIIPIFINHLMKEHKLLPADIKAIAISAGPGSYTGLRVAASIAKGLCYTWDIPLIAISTLQMMAAGMIAIAKDKDACYCPMIDARRMEVFAAIFDAELNIRMNQQSLILEKESLTDYVTQNKMILFGNGSEKVKDTIGIKENILFKDYKISASHLAPLSQFSLINKHFEDLAYFTPFYLKGFYKPEITKTI